MMNVRTCLGFVWHKYEMLGVHILMEFWLREIKCQVILIALSDLILYLFLYSCRLLLPFCSLSRLSVTLYMHWRRVFWPVLLISDCFSSVCPLFLLCILFRPSFFPSSLFSHSFSAFNSSFPCSSPSPSCFLPFSFLLSSSSSSSCPPLCPLSASSSSSLSSPLSPHSLQVECFLTYHSSHVCNTIYHHQTLQ